MEKDIFAKNEFLTQNKNIFLFINNIPIYIYIYIYI